MIGAFAASDTSVDTSHHKRGDGYSYNDELVRHFEALQNCLHTSKSKSFRIIWIMAKQCKHNPKTIPKITPAWNHFV